MCHVEKVLQMLSVIIMCDFFIWFWEEWRRDPRGKPWALKEKQFWQKENVTLTLVFLLPPFDTLTWHCRPAWQRKRKPTSFLLTWFMFAFLQRVAFVISHLKMQDNLRGKSRSHFLIALINPASSEGERTFAFVFPATRPPSLWCFLPCCVP